MLSLVVISIANYVATGLRFGKVVEAKADRLAAADAGLRYGVERLQLQSYAPCITGLGDSGYTIDFPFNVNNATVDVSCRKDGSGFSDIQSWAIVVTGEGVPNGQWHLHSQGGGGVQKLLGGPVYVSQPDKISLQAPVTVEDGDIWYSSTDCSGPVPAVDNDLTFKPAFRGLMCVQAPWTTLYSTPAANVPTNLPALPYLDGSCNVFSPGKYLAMPILGANNYFKSGEYYFENVTINIQNAVVTAGWADFDRYGDQQFLANGPCAGAISADALSGSQAGATFYLGGTSKIEVSNKGKLEILRRRQGVNVVSVQALETVGPGYIPSTVSWNTSIMWTKSGAQHRPGRARARLGAPIVDDVRQHHEQCQWSTPGRCGLRPHRLAGVGIGVELHHPSRRLPGCLHAHPRSERAARRAVDPDASGRPGRRCRCDCGELLASRRMSRTLSMVTHAARLRDHNW